MKFLPTSYALTGIATALFLVTAPVSVFAQVQQPDLVPVSNGTGIISGYGYFPNEAFVIANKDDGATQAPCPGGNIRGDIADMTKTFTTSKSGLVEVKFCGVLDMFSDPSHVGVRALVDSSPGADVMCQPGDIEWDASDALGGDGPRCFTWLCAVSNPNTCGWKNNQPCPTQHTIKMQCGTGNIPNLEYDGAQFNERSLWIRYDRY